MDELKKIAEEERKEQEELKRKEEEKRTLEEEGKHVLSVDLEIEIEIFKDNKTMRKEERRNKEKEALHEHATRNAKLVEAMKKNTSDYNSFARDVEATIKEIIKKLGILENEQAQDDNLIKEREESIRKRKEAKKNTSKKDTDTDEDETDPRPQFAQTFKPAMPVTCGEELRLSNVERLNVAAVEAEMVNKATESVITKPLDGQLFVFDVKRFPEWRSHLKIDGYRWSQQKTHHTHRFVVINCSTINNDNKRDSRWRKLMIWDKQTNLVAIQYHGDPSISSSRPHGSCAKSDRPLIHRSNVVLASKVAASTAEGVHLP
jgi:hypothetical protein